MISFNRRQLVAGIGAAFATGITGSEARAAMGPIDKFDRVIKGGEVLDPSQRLRGKLDVGIRYGRIEALEADIPAVRANRVMNAAGRLVVPGLIDLHAHVFTSGIGIPADELVLYQGTTTAASASDAGASTFATSVRCASCSPSWLLSKTSRSTPPASPGVFSISTKRPKCRDFTLPSAFTTSRSTSSRRAARPARASARTGATMVRACWRMGTK